MARKQTDSATTPIKKLIAEALRGYKSSHLSEALATSLGYRTHAAYLADIADPDRIEWSNVDAIDIHAFTRRLVELSGDRVIDGTNVPGAIMDIRFNNRDLLIPRGPRARIDVVDTPNPFPRFDQLGITLGDDWLHLIGGLETGLVLVAGPIRSGLTSTVLATVDALIEKGRASARFPFLEASPAHATPSAGVVAFVAFGVIDGQERLREALRLSMNHVVIAEFHGESVAGALRRLAEMELPARLRGRLHAVLSQRLLGKHCTNAHAPWMRCPQCAGKSTRDPALVSELQIFTTEAQLHGAILDAIDGRSTVRRSMRQDALVKLDQGRITGSDFDAVFGTSSPIVKSFGV